MSDGPDSRFVGRPFERLDGPAKLTGSALYTADRFLPGQAQAWVVSSPIASGRLLGVDAAAARAAPGVRLVLFPGSHPELASWVAAWGQRSLAGLGEPRLPLADELIHYHGQALALVVADTLLDARRAAALLRLELEPAELALTLGPTAPDAYPAAKVGSRPASLTRLAEGVPSLEAALAEADVRFEACYETAFGHHHPMEPHVTLASWESDRLTVFEPTQWLVGARRAYAEVFGLAVEQVRVHGPFVGGGFGSKTQVWPHGLLAAFAARLLERPVQVALGRDQLASAVGHRPASWQRIELGARRDGRLVAARHRSLTTTSRLVEYLEPTGHATTGLVYGLPNLELEHRLLPLPVGPPMWMRAPGEAPGSFALESALDELAWALALDPIALRVANEAAVHPLSGLPWSSRHLVDCYRLGAERFGWARRSPLPRAQRQGGAWLGQGMATAHYPGHRSPASARVTLLPDGAVEVASATHELGTGVTTLLAQVAAEELGVPLARVRVRLGDSELPAAPVSGGSMSTASVLPAVQEAARELARRLAQEPAAPRPLSATASVAPGPERSRYAFCSFGAHFVEVRVDARTFETRVLRVVTVVDIGRVVNPLAARSQIQGGVVWGIGMALSEDSSLAPESGRFQADDLSTYHVPVALDVPAIEVHFLDRPDPQIGPLGARGAGEIGITGVAAAVANAVYHATDLRVRKLPLTPDQLLAAQKSAR
jgi:xanthine dehydrogenase YagR molybdenum-binding subunit